MAEEIKDEASEIAEITREAEEEAQATEASEEAVKETTEEQSADTKEETIKDAETEEAEEEEPSTSDEETGEVSGETGEKKDKGEKVPRGVQKRIGELTRARRDEERLRKQAEKERDEWRQAALKEGKEEKGEPAEETGKKPTPDDYDDYEDYNEALAEWLVERKTTEILATVDKKRKKDDETKAQEVHNKEIQNKLDKGREKYEDFDEVALNEAIPCSDSMAQAVFDSDITDDVLYYLGTHADEADRISQLSPIAAAREIGKIEAFLTNPKPTPKKKLSSPHELIEPVGSKSTIKKNLEDMEQDEFETEANKLLKEKVW